MRCRRPNPRATRARSICSSSAANPDIFLGIGPARRSTRRRVFGPGRRFRRGKWSTTSAGTKKFLVLRPAVSRLGQPDFFFAQRRAVGVVAVGLVRGAESDHTAHLDQCRPVGRKLEIFYGGAKAVQIVDVVKFQYVPAVTGESLGHVLAKTQRRATSIVMRLSS